KGKTLTDLQFRASYGQTGKDRLNDFIVSAFSYYAGYNFIPTAGGSSVLDGNYVPGVDPRGLPITNLSWITNTNINFGLDAYLFDRKIFIQTDLFERRRSGLPAGRYDVLLPNE